MSRACCLGVRMGGAAETRGYRRRPQHHCPGRVSPHRPLTQRRGAASALPPAPQPLGVVLDGAPLHQKDHILRDVGGQVPDPLQLLGHPPTHPGSQGDVQGLRRGRWSIRVSCAGKVQEPAFPTSTVVKCRIYDALTTNLPVLTTAEVDKPPRSHIRVIETRFVHRLPRVAGRGRVSGAICPPPPAGGRLEERLMEGPRPGRRG